MQHKSELRKEIIGGLTTFFTMAYIVVVNPSILSTEGTGMPFSGVLTATVLLSFLMTLMMGLYAKLPFGVAPGMGINAFFTYNLVLGKGVPWPIALGTVFWGGVFFLLVSVTPLRAHVAAAIPKQLRAASAAGIGIFLTFIGLKNANFIAADPVTYVKLGSLGADSMLALLGLAIIVFLVHRRSSLAFLACIAIVTLLSWALGLLKAPETFFSQPDFSSVLFKLDIWNALQLSLLPAIFVFLFTDFFDSISTFVGVSQATGLLDKDGNPKNLKQGLIVDAWATFSAGLLGTSSGTAYIESSAGIEAGGRTGKSAVVTALCFLPCLFIAPLAAMVPPQATAPVLIVVGAMMFRCIDQLRTGKLEELIPAYLTIVLIPLTFSITQGILWGFISHVIFYTMVGRARELKPTLVIVAALSVVLLLLET
jgi:AGZA family xanthine/uracil permease-like MFS transporter